MEPEPTDIRFTVNGREVHRSVNGEMTLLEFLRGELGLTGARNGCGTGHCGACTVLLGGRTVKSCTVRMKSTRLAGAEVVTIEGLRGPDGGLHPVQQAFIDAGAVQCGFCTPGMILSAKALLDSNPQPGRREIRRHFHSRNLCRCTGYEKIFQAVGDAAGRLAGERSLLDGCADDASVTRAAAALKVTGEIRYADDISPPEVVHGALLFSREPHAILESLDAHAALEMNGVIGVITAEDFKGTRRIGLVESDQPAMVAVGEEIRSVGDLLCAVFAESSAAAARARDAIAAGYRILPGVFTTEQALAPDAPQVRPDRPGNIFYDRQLVRGDAAAALDSADIVVSGRFSTSRVVHGFLEPESGLAFPDGEGGVEIRYPTQTVFDDRDQIARAVGLPKNRVRVVQLPTGGAFGGKEDLIFQPVLALAALKFNRPVKITLSRAESLKVTQKKHPTEFEVSLGVNRDGSFRALSADILTDKGAYASLGFDIVENMMAFIGGCYYIPELRVRGRSVYTHNVFSGAMRGFGANQSNFVIESLVDEAARRTGLDGFEIRRRNALRPGLPTITAHVLEPGVPAVLEVIEACRRAVGELEAPECPEGFVPGFGMACGVKNIGFGHHLPESAGARVILESGGSCRISVTHAEYGQGAAIGEARIASEVLGIPVGRIQVDMPDTARTPFTGASTASRQTFLSGNAVRGACELLLSRILTRAALLLDLDDPACLAVTGDSVVRRGRENEPALALADLGINLEAEFRAIAPETDAFPDGDTGLFGDPAFRSRRTHWAYAYGAQAAWVAVNPADGETRVLRIVTVSDVGRVLNRRAVEGQQEGGVMMGVGYALSEQFIVEDGRNLTTDLGGCGLPRAGQVPEIVGVVVEVPHPAGPLGAKGFAEAPSLATAPAVANAIFDAVGVRMRHLPITPARLKGEIDGHDNQKRPAG